MVAGGGNGNRVLFAFRVRHLAVVAALASPGGWAAWQAVTRPDTHAEVQAVAREVVAEQVRAQLEAGWGVWIEREKIADDQTREVVARGNGNGRALRELREELAEVLSGAARRRVLAIEVPPDLRIMDKPAIAPTPDEARRRQSTRP